jgi:hypothetical protein
MNGSKTDIKKVLRLRAWTSRLCKNRWCGLRRSVTGCALPLQEGEPRRSRVLTSALPLREKARECPRAIDRGVSYVTTAAELESSSLVQPQACGK